MVQQSSAESPCDETSSAEELKRKSTMKIAITEGCFGIGSNTVTDNFLVPFALAIQSTPFQVGILTALPGIVNPTGQVIGSHLMYTHSRRGIIINGILGMALTGMMLLVMSIFAAITDEIIWEPITWFLLAFYGLYNLAGGLMSPSWVSNMGDIVPPDSRGRYFAKRNLITTATSMSIAMGLSIWLQDFEDHGLVLLGFVILFVIGLGARLTSWGLFHKHYYPRLTITKENHVRLRDFVRDLPRTNFGQFTLLVMLITFGQWIGGSFFNVYMLTPVSGGGLGFDYVTFVFMGVITSLVSLFAFPFVGKFGDKYGNVRLMRLGAIIVPTLPIMWVFLNTPIGIALGPQVWGGIGWTAFNLATSNFIYDSVPSQKRGAYVAYYTLVVGIGQIAGGILGSSIIAIFPPAILGTGAFLVLFLLSGITRAIFVAIYLPRVKEINQKAKPIFNMKAGGIYKVLHDILLRETHNHKKNGNGNGHDKAVASTDSPPHT
nr:MFS transporter [Candidatus Sigynarchaeota archaeon]